MTTKSKTKFRLNDKRTWYRGGIKPKDEFVERFEKLDAELKAEGKPSLYELFGLSDKIKDDDKG